MDDRKKPEIGELISIHEFDNSIRVLKHAEGDMFFGQHIRHKSVFKFCHKNILI